MQGTVAGGFYEQQGKAAVTKYDKSKVCVERRQAPLDDSDSDTHNVSSFRFHFITVTH